MLKRVVLGLIALLVGGTGLIGIEIVVALRRDYLPTEPALKLDDTFGDPTDEEVTLVVMGDSTAAGVGAGAPANAYPQLLARRLASDGYRVDLRVFGSSGARVSDILDEQLPKAIEAAPDYLFIGIGANDVTHVTTLSDLRSDMTAVIRELRHRTDAEIVVAGAPDMRAPAFLEPLRSLSGWRGRQVAGAIEEVGRQEDAVVVELAKQTGPQFGADPERFHSPDDFHPSAAGYELWADAIYPVLRRVVEN
ncbi:MAG: SGNH/GDSL hydrolase family protein [Actinomycetota bacterium]